MERTAPLDVIAASLRRERERHGISLAELARRANLAKSTLSQLEAAVGNPTVAPGCAPPAARRDLHVLTAEPGGARDAHAHLPGTTEHVVVAAGRWRAGPVGAEVEL